MLSTKDTRVTGHSIAVTDNDDDVVFMAQPATAHPDRPSSLTLQGRFVAGEAFFNYAAFGSLREGLPAVNLATQLYGGLAVHAMLAGVNVSLFQYAFRPLLVAFLLEFDADQIQAGESLVQWMGTLSVFIGLTSDCYPFFGYRRKSYMLLGWIFACVMYTTIAILHATGNRDGYTYLVVTTLASLGFQVAWITSLALTIELAQREHLYERGHLQAFFFVLHFGSALLAQVGIMTTVFPADDGVSMLPTTKMHMGECATALAIVCILPLPFISRYLSEPPANCSSRLTLTIRLRELWHLLQQKVVYCIFFFLVGSLFLLGASSPSVTQAIMFWSGIMPSKMQYINFFTVLPKLAAVLIWKSVLVNWNWRRMWLLGLTIFIVGQLALLPCVYFSAVRHEWYFYVMILIAQLPQGWMDLLVVIMPTEIADIGREGVMIGLVNSFIVLITIASGSLWTSLNEAVDMNVSLEDILEDSAETRHQIFVAALIYGAINALGVFTAWFLPAQKLDAQQMRAFGGYNRMARNAILFVFAALLIYDLVENLAKI
ncbi:hypothetical protein Poli38472_010927 [Pythium oligandrum]|uniref:Uncharacterized protein n=1 Tax=Pythium oligandrum TaxID=41045 RepID=A0A8K1CF32_PYTOL|nr:hypothetical protein Poli38472_010927 [Pythium oligandrum]|eukprot:TMW61864.1 hypothetical protein Poli38472_010927 [Pythium oligandrum]